MARNHVNARGFSILEVVIVLALLALVAALLLSGFRQYVAYQQFTQSVRDIQLTLQEAQTEARLSVGGVAHGVKIGTASTTQFVGTTYSSSDPSNVVREFSYVTLTPVLSGGTDEIVFSVLSGYPTATGTITIAGTAYAGSVSLEVTAGGVVQY